MNSTVAATKKKTRRKGYFNLVQCNIPAKNRPMGMRVGQFTWCAKSGHFNCVHGRRHTRCKVCHNVFCSLHEKYKSACNMCKKSNTGTCQKHTPVNGCAQCSVARLPTIAKTPTLQQPVQQHENSVLYFTKKAHQAKQRTKLCHVHTIMVESCATCNNPALVVKQAFCNTCLPLVKSQCTECNAVRQRLKAAKQTYQKPAKTLEKSTTVPTQEL